jgi:hypothetical protein
MTCALGLVACGPSTSPADFSRPDAGPRNQWTADANPYADSDIPPLIIIDSGIGVTSQTCHDWQGNDIASDQGASFDDDGDCACETAPCTGSSNPSCGALIGGDCNDCDPLVSPSAIEVNGDKVDNNCDGLTDDSGSIVASPCSASGTCPGSATCDSTTDLCNDAPDPACSGVASGGACEGACDTSALAGSGAAADFAKSLGLCNGEVVSAPCVSPSDAKARAIMTKFGTDSVDKLNNPSQGATFVMLSTGAANTASHDQGTDLGNTAPNPDKTVTQACGVDPNAIDFTTGLPITCNSASDCAGLLGPSNDLCVNHECRPAPPDTVNDYTELKLQLRVPSNAKSFSYRFQYYSSEYPTYRCSAFNDTFLAELTSKAFNGGKEGNISFDANNHVVSVDNGFFQVCDVNDGTASSPNANDPNAPANNCLATPNADTVMGGTGFSPKGDPNGLSSGAGATVELTTQNVPVQPGETITLRYIIFDEGDGIIDSSVLLDNFQWSATPATPGGPVTTPPVIP